MGADYRALSFTGSPSSTLPKEVDTELADAIFSDLVTYFRSDDIDLTRGYPRRVASDDETKGNRTLFHA
jgi:hypothetical protein